jgi:RNA polymerase sigma factor (sigma-70 family)
MSDVLTISPHRDQPDERLVCLAASGSVAAFELIVARYRGPLTRACAGAFPARLVDDVVQQTFINAWTAFNHGTEVRDLRAWLYQISRNCGYQLARQARCTDTLVGDVASGDGAHDILERKLRLRAVLDAVALLPDRQRAALVSTAVDGRSGHDVAAVLGVNESTLRQLVRRARVAVRAAAAAVGLPAPLLRLLSSRMPAVASRVSVAPGAGGTAVITKAVAAAVLVAATATAAPGVVHHFSAGAGPHVSSVSDSSVYARAVVPIGSPAADGQPGSAALLQPSQIAGRPQRHGGHRHRSRAGASAQGTGAVAADPTGSGSEPSATDASAGESPGAAPPAVEPPAAEPTAGESPGTEPSAGEPPGPEPPAEEPATEPIAKTASSAP